MDDRHRLRSAEYREAFHSREAPERDRIKTDDRLEALDTVITETDRPIPDMGCGRGNDTLYLPGKGKRVCAFDRSPCAVKKLPEKFPEISDARCFDMTDGLPYGDEAFDAVIADLCLQ